ncbi:B-cell receptor CD22-like isoform X2 [Phyllobates terribilis]|uniref:B-cell receptor CD22-like isoform X2 n=1 Tax=Phyllobates terribilis TaxID=111132 RepID=UPI003CCAF6AC
MTQHFFLVEGWLLLLLTLGSFAEENEHEWAFTFPQIIKVRKHSDVEIPCTFTAPDYDEDVHIVWYKYHELKYPKVYSDDDLSEVLPEYNNRTSLIRNGTNSCSLRIKDVRYTAWYYPGISENINSYKLNKERKAVQVKVSGCNEETPCKDWGFSFPQSLDVLKGSCVEIPCRITYPNDAQNFSLFWYQNVLKGYPRIINRRNPTDVEKKYKGRTSLVGNSMDNCSLRINNVEEPVKIYPGINEDINSYYTNNERFCTLSIIEAPPQPIINGADHMKEEEPVSITCSVTHTCASSPPNITWNKPDLDLIMSHEDLDRGVWRIKSIIKYIPLYRDDKTKLTCTVTFPNRKISEQSVTLDIKYKPKNVTITVQPMEGDYIILLCTSHANPSITNYAWYKGEKKTFARIGEHMTVLNVSSDTYVCSATNDIGTRNSSIFSFTNHYDREENSKNILIIGGAVIFLALAVTVLVVIFFILKRRRNTSSAHVREKRTQESDQVTEKIMMENVLYENFDDVSKKDSPRTRNQILEKNNSGEERNSCQGKAKMTEDSIVYCSVELLPASRIPRNTEETEYAQLNI